MIPTICRQCGQPMGEDNPPARANPNVCCPCAYGASPESNPSLGTVGRWDEPELRQEAAKGQETPRKVFQGTLAQVAIQCIDPETGMTGSWLFTGLSHRELGSRVTPVFADVYDLTQNLKGQWESVTLGHYRKL